jgi:hypothetical protein
METENLKTQLLMWDKKLENTMALLRKLKKQHALKEEAAEKLITDISGQLGASYERIETLIQQKENLKHRILRLRLMNEGKADDNLDSIVKRLVKETERLRNDMGVLAVAHSREGQAHQALQLKHVQSERALKRVESELDRRSQAISVVTETFEMFLRSKAIKLAGARVPLTDARVQETLSNLSQTMLSALVDISGGKVSVPTLNSSNRLPPPHGSSSGNLSAMPSTSQPEFRTSDGQDRMKVLYEVARSSGAMASAAALRSTARPRQSTTDLSLPNESVPDGRPGSGANDLIEASKPLALSELSEKTDNLGSYALPLTESQKLLQPIPVVSPRRPDSESGSSDGGKRRFPKQRARYKIPSRLLDLAANNAFVDGEQIQLLDQGFRALEQFKKLSREYAEDAKGLKIRNVDPSADIRRDASISAKLGVASLRDPEHAQSPAQRAKLRGPASTASSSTHLSIIGNLTVEFFICCFYSRPVV